ncbi:potassium channel family protein [Allocoleopsis franciscana]|uniref:K+ transport system, NAD-binding component n=1 Tax=Allocoleopsis franciscana PCC 7113 TaxID=1173027 RepID=K9WCP3_9CYAN|nr:NAD-binding protein [Allocoleopsis franciscana]AFZ18008.1 K+ transport system, NAD-binding component [Allocoleopsis franciscana PCC 7113]
MYLIIVGAGPEGSSLAELALKDGHRVTIIEKDEKRAQAVLQKYDIQVFHANIAQGGILDEADADQADALIATMEDDSANLMTMFLGKERGIKKLISMINDRQHQAMFERLGVQVLVDPEVIIAQHLYSFLG